MRIKLKYILVLCVLTFNTAAFAQKQKQLIYDKDAISSPLSFDKEKINDYQDDTSFDYKEIVAQDNWYTRFKTWLSTLYNKLMRWIFDRDETTGFWALVIDALPYIIIAAVIGFLIWLFIRVDMAGSPLTSKLPNRVILHDDETIIQSQDIPKLIKKALDDKNYRLAIRYYYLLALQQLSEKEIIDWQVQKTNNDYLFEIKNTSLKNQFKNITRIYDFIWYGNFEVDYSAFAKAELEFKKIHQSL